MPLQRKYADVLLDDPNGGEPQLVSAEIRVIDQSRTEERGIDPSKQNQKTGFSWAYFALLREGQISKELKFPQFLEQAVQVDIRTVGVVDPTKQAASDDSASSSQPDSAGPSPGG